MFQLIFYGVIVAAIAGFIWAHDHGIRTDEAAKWKPKLEQAEANYKKLGDQYKEQRSKVEELSSQSVAAQLRAEAALKVVAAKDAQLAKKKAELNAIITGPVKQDRQEDCNEARTILDDFVADRLRQP